MLVARFNIALLHIQGGAVGSNMGIIFYKLYFPRVDWVATASMTARGEVGSKPEGDTIIQRRDPRRPLLLHILILLLSARRLL